MSTSQKGHLGVFKVQHDLLFLFYWAKSLIKIGFSSPMQWDQWPSRSMFLIFLPSEMTACVTGLYQHLCLWLMIHLLVVSNGLDLKVFWTIALTSAQLLESPIYHAGYVIITQCFNMFSYTENHCWMVSDLSGRRSIWLHIKCVLYSVCGKESKQEVNSTKLGQPQLAFS